MEQNLSKFYGERISVNYNDILQGVTQENQQYFCVFVQHSTAHVFPQ